MFAIPNNPQPSPSPSGVSKTALIAISIFLLVAVVGGVVFLRMRSVDEGGLAGDLRVERGAERPAVAGEARPANPDTDTVVPAAVLPPDTDGDGIRDTDEQTLGTNPQKVDSDDDGASDFEEIYTRKSNPLVKDARLTHPALEQAAPPAITP